MTIKNATGMVPDKRMPRTMKAGRTEKVKRNKFISRPVDHRLHSFVDRLEAEGWKIEVEGFVSTPDGKGRWVARLCRLVNVAVKEETK